MGEKRKNYTSEDVIGNVRTGTRGEKDKPIKLAYFDVHTDKSTPELAVEIFNDVYNKPTKLKIRFINQNPLSEGFQRYEGKKLRCYGNGNEARLLDDKGKRQLIKCENEECEYFKERKCKRVGRIYFLIEKLEGDGIWCYPMGSEKGIRNIKRRIARANRIGEDLTKNWFELYLRVEDGLMGKNYIPDIRKISGESSINDNQLQDVKKEVKPNITNNKNYMKIIGFQIANYENKKLPKIICIDTSSKKHELILMPESKQDILKLNTESIIMPLSISKREEFTILNDYKIVKAITQNIENKKAV